MKKLLMIVAVLLSVTSCKTQQPFQLTFGSGGGFSGLYNTYSLGEDGKVYKQASNTKEKTQVATLKKSDIKDIEAMITKVNFPAANINNPGNMSFSVNLTRDGKAYTNTWSGTSSGNAALDELYKKLISYISKQ